MRSTVLVVDDQQLPRQALSSELEDAGFAVVEARDGEEAWGAFVSDEPDVVISDVVMPRADGIDLLTRIRAMSEVPVILFTSQGTAKAAATAFKSGADDFICSRDVEIEDLVAVVANAARGTESAPDAALLEDQLAGRSRAMVRTREHLAGLAALRTPVLVSGEPGTGRRTAIRILSELGHTNGAAIVDVDAEGFELDAGAPEPRVVHLHNIEEFPGRAQTYWTERIETLAARHFCDGPRILASSVEPLSVLGQNEKFSRGMGRILLRFALELPPLRSLDSDLSLIADVLVQRVATSLGRRTKLSPAARKLLAQQRWRGNVSELERVIERAVAYSSGRQVRRETIADVLSEQAESLESFRELGSKREREQLVALLQETGGNVTHTADAMERSRSAIYRMIEKHGITLRKNR